VARADVIMLAGGRVPWASVMCAGGVVARPRAWASMYGVFDEANRRAATACVNCGFAAPD